MADGHRPAGFADDVTGLLDDVALGESAVVANCAMNRERQLAGVNSYTRELGFNPLDFVTAQAGGVPAVPALGAPGPAAPAPAAAWLDLCCGTGRALIQAAGQLDQAGLAGRVSLTGVDLVPAFDPVPPSAVNLRLVCAAVATWLPDRAFDLITCVHGLHYVGDKLTVLARAAGWLTPTGRFVADLDLSAIQLPGGRAATRRLASRLRTAGFSYDSRRRQISCTGRRDIRWPYTYRGADDHAGPGYTGQPAVHSYYAEGGEAGAGNRAAALRSR
jgi:SAM-dependent methyltransferase